MMSINVVFTLICIITITHIIQSQTQTEPTCATTKYSSNNFDRRSNKHQLIIAEYNVEFLFHNQSSCTSHTLTCPGNSCRWNNDSMAILHMQYIANVITKLNADILILIETEDCCTIQWFFDNYLPQILQQEYNYYLIKGSDSYTGQNIALFTKIDPINDPIRDKRSISYPNINTLCTDTATGTKTISKNLIANFSGIENFPDFVLIGIHLLAQPSNPSRCLEREAQADIVAEIIKSYENTNYNDFIIIGDFNDYDNAFKDAHNHTSITNVFKFIKESITPNLINTVKYINQQIKRYTHWPQSTFDPLSGDICGFGEHSSSYLDQYDYILLSQKLASYIDNVTIYHNYCNVLSSDHIPIVIKLQTPYISSEYIASFGFKTANIAYSGGNANTLVYIKLHWGQYLFQCSLFAPEGNTLYLCDATNTIQTENCENYDINIQTRYVMYIEYKSTNQLFFDEIVIYDVSGNLYGINKFCVSIIETETIGEGIGMNDYNCSDSNNYMKYDILCLDDSCVDSVKIELMDSDPIQNVKNSYKSYGIVSKNNNKISDGLICISSPTTEPTYIPTFAPSNIVISTTEIDTTNTKNTIDVSNDNVTKNQIVTLIVSIVIVLLFMM